MNNDDIESKINKIIDDIKVIYNYKDSYVERTIYDKDTKSILSGRFPVINDIYQRFLGRNLDIRQFANLIVKNIYQKDILNIETKISDIIKCISYMYIIKNTEKKIDIVLEDVDEKKSFKNISKKNSEDMLKEQISKIKKLIFTVVKEKCANVYNIINITAINQQIRGAHDLNLILEKKNEKIYVYLFDPNGNAINRLGYEFFFVSNFLSTVFDEDDRFVFKTDFLSCDISIHSFNPNEFTNRGNCALFSFFWYYCVLSYCIKYKKSFEENVTIIHNLIINRFKRNTDEMIDIMCNLIIDIFGDENKLHENILKYVNTSEQIKKNRFNIEKEIKLIDEKEYNQKQDFYKNKKMILSIKRNEKIYDSEGNVIDIRLKKQRLYNENIDIDIPILTTDTEIDIEYYSKIIKNIQYIIDNRQLFSEINISQLDRSLNFYYLEYLIEKM